MLLRAIYILFLLFLGLPIYSQQQNYQSFSNITLDSEASAIYCFAQDNLGLIWVGSSKGLFSFDGFSAQQHISPESNIHVYCITIIDDEYLCFGCDNGVFFYNYKTDRYEDINIDFPTDVRTMILRDNMLWIGSLNGLYRYNLDTKQLENITARSNSGIPHKTIYSIIEFNDNVYVGTYDGFCKYVSEKDSFIEINLPQDEKRSNLFVNVLYQDTVRNCIWIGTEGHLYKYTPLSAKIENFNLFYDNSVKSLITDQVGNLLVGTDNGLYIFNEQTNNIQHIVHDSRTDRSLSNNIVWGIFSDKERNIWLGTDYNISLLRFNKAFQTIPISQITGIGDGNRFHTIYKDTRNNFWLGGTNGLIHTHLLDESKQTIWYRMDNRQYPISHNRIRHIYEDKDNNVWVATDGSISRYDYNKKQFIHYSITDSTRTYNSNWAYHLFEDDKGQLWIATCLGGIFVVNKQKLINSSGNYVAEYNYTIAKGLSGMFINQIIPDKQGNVWVLLYKDGLNKINVKENRIEKIKIEDKTQNENPNCILCDAKGIIWAGFRNGLLSINPDTNESNLIKFSSFGGGEVLSMIEEESNIWLSTTDGMWIVNKETHDVQRPTITNKSFTAGFYDKNARQIYWGASDELAILTPSLSKSNEAQTPIIILTSLFINEKLYVPNTADKKSIRYLDDIKLNYKQNNLVFEFSDLIYSQDENNKFVYRLENFDGNWNILSDNTNRISYTNLDYGNYILKISKLDSTGKPSSTVFSFPINITPPWYYTIWAKIIYALLGLGLIIWIINFFRVRNNLRIERIEKEKTLELSNLKIDFFTNVSHEFKTPLSLIIAPVSKLILDTKDSYKKKELELVQRNALKLNSLIRQIIDFNRNDKIGTELVLSKVEFVEFAKSLFSVYRESYKDKSLTFSFSTNKDKIYADIDVLKIESVLNNLIANACKYTNEGNIDLSLNYNEENKSLDITVNDTGIGIPQNEIPYVFERFYQSSKTSKDKEGTGIGLYLVKTYTEQHGGNVNIKSSENKGTRITITLPAFSSDEITEVIKYDKQDENLPKVLIVEDNPEIADFIFHILEGKYRSEVCHNGKQGLDMAIQTNPDIIVADIMMPIMDGLEMTRRIRKNTPTSTIPIILLTAKDDKQTELESINLNVDAFISKPFDPQILLSRIEQLLNNKQQIESKIRIETLTTPKPIEATSPDEKLLSSITGIIEDKVSDPDLNVNSLSTISGIGSKQIYRKLKQLTGMSPVEYIRSVRMKKAAMLLTQNKFTISEVMYMVGFSNHSYFAKCFQAEFRKTPKQFIEDNK